MGKRWRGSGGKGKVMFTIYCTHDGYFLVTRFFFFFLAIPTYCRRRTYSDSLLSIWAADFQRGCREGVLDCLNLIF